MLRCVLEGKLCWLRGQPWRAVQSALNREVSDSIRITMAESHTAENRILSLYHRETVMGARFGLILLIKASVIHETERLLVIMGPE